MISILDERAAEHKENIGWRAIPLGQFREDVALKSMSSKEG